MVARRPSRARTPKPRRGRPHVHDESWTKVSVVLFDRQIKQLDRILRELRQPDGKRLTRASLIRAFLDGLLKGGVEIAPTASETDLRDQIVSIVRGSRR
jgi:hypothetical protein